MVTDSNLVSLQSAIQEQKSLEVQGVQRKDPEQV